jgi:integrase
MKLYQREIPAIDPKTGKHALSPFYYAEFTVEGERHRVSTGMKTKKEAREVGLRLWNEAQGAKARGGVAMTIGRAVDDYLAELEVNRKPWHKQALKLSHKTFGRVGFHGQGRFKVNYLLALTGLSEDLIDSLKLARTREGNSPQTIAHELKVLRSAVIRAGRKGAAVPVLKWDVPVPKGKTRWLTTDEWRQVYDELDPARPIADPDVGPRVPSGRLLREREQTQDLFVTLTMCGGRWGEVSRLTVDQVLMGGFVKLYGYKTQRERLVPCPAIMWEALERRRKVAESLGTPYLFPPGSVSGRQPKARPPGGSGGPLEFHAPKDHQVCSAAIRRAFERAGVNAPHRVARDGRATIHSLRHTFASWLLQDGMSLQELQELLGHESPIMTQRYAHLATGQSVSVATEKMGRMVSGVLATAA